MSSFLPLPPQQPLRLQQQLLLLTVLLLLQ
jgi:hypothetical protein